MSRKTRLAGHLARRSVTYATLATLAPFATCIAFAAAAVSACEPTVAVGARICPRSPNEAGATPDPGTAVPLSWTTGVEEGFCDYALPLGFCFATGIASYGVVTSPVHSGRFAAAFSVRVDGDAGAQARCVDQGVFPAAAYCGAWYYVPAPATNSAVWNLLHFQGGVPGQTLHGLWDVSLVSRSDGTLLAVLYDFLTGTTSDTSGELSLWQDGVMTARLAGLPTDDTDWGQFYVGNLADALLPPSSTLYVDDVTIGDALQ